MQGTNQELNIDSLIIEIHDVARKMEQYKGLSLRHEAFIIRNVADSVSTLVRREQERAKESAEKRERYAHTLPHTRNRIYSCSESND